MRCEDFPCCGHEAGDCDGSLYGSDESIKARVCEDIRNGHGDCDHAEGVFNCEYDDYDEDDYEANVELLARELCDTYYLTVDPERMMQNAYDKISEATREHWRAQARLMMDRGVSIR